MKGYNVSEYGIVADGKTLNSVALQKLIDFCFSQGGGEIIFPKGEYVLSTVFLKSNVHIVLEKDAVILGAESFYEYAAEEKLDYPLYQDSSHSFFHCSLFVGIGCDTISITGEGKIDMRSVWDEDNVRKIKHRGPKCIALKECNNVVIGGIGIYNATDLAVYFAGCKDVEISNLTLRVYIDGISPDNCDNVKIYNCNVETGDDGIVFKSSHTLNRYEDCQNIEVYNCKIKSRCNAIKFGTESNHSFKNFYIHDCEICDTRISGIAIESVDGAIIDNITIKNIHMVNVNAPLFIHLGERLRGPIGTKVGSISNIRMENISAVGEYKPYTIIPWDYVSFTRNLWVQDPHVFHYINDVYEDVWQFTSNICGLKGHLIENITLKNIYFEVDGGVCEYDAEVPEEPLGAYPEVDVYGKTLPASGLYCRYVKNLNIHNFTVKVLRPDKRKFLVCEKVENCICT